MMLNSLLLIYFFTLWTTRNVADNILRYLVCLLDNLAFNPHLEQCKGYWNSGLWSPCARGWHADHQLTCRFAGHCWRRWNWCDRCVHWQRHGVDLLPPSIPWAWRQGPANCWCCCSLAPCQSHLWGWNPQAACSSQRLSTAWLSCLQIAFQMAVSKLEVQPADTQVANTSHAWQATGQHTLKVTLAMANSSCFRPLILKLQEFDSKSTNHWLTTESVLGLTSAAIWSYWFFPLFLNSWDSQILAHDSGRCCRHCTPHAEAGWFPCPAEHNVITTFLQEATVKRPGINNRA